jgi:type IV pilus assembly protein PilY1
MKAITLITKLTVIATLSLFWLPQSTADDTEIYQSSIAATDNGRPKVLIIFDDSGSMDTQVFEQPPGYDPSQTYTGTRVNNRIYFSLTSTNNYFPATANRCAMSYDALDTAGFYGGKFQRARQRSNPTRYDWVNLGNNNATKNAIHVDCEDDYDEENNSNGPGEPLGYPCENGGNPGDVNNYYCTNRDNINWGGATTIYTGNYLNWYYSAGNVVRTRMDIAQATVNAIIDANPAIDFGLMTFNHNNTTGTDDGARLINRIVENANQSYRDSVKSNVSALTTDGWTPLCESMYEAYRYLTGSEVFYGDMRDTARDPIARDTAAESGNNYIAPTTDCAYTYIILMTDGEPTRDNDADNEIEALIGRNCSGNCLDEIAEYMSNTDLDGDDSNGDQFAITYTIGFATDQQLLEDTAAKGKGKYYTADSATGLATAFQSAIFEILSTNESFTSPAVAVDTFSRTESRDEVFFAMFEPQDRVDWRGNIKRLNLVIDNGTAVLKDANGNLAFNNTTGRISDTAQTVWSTTTDGDRVSDGGVGRLLAERDPDTRNIYTNTGDDGALEEFNETNLDPAAFGESTTDALHALWGVQDAVGYTRIVNFAQGYDVDDDDGDNDRTDAREWIMADMLHSRPVVINYGALGSHTEANPEQRLIVGTNGGFLHMFDVEDGSESWAFTPKELVSIHARRYENIASTNHVYGIDAPPSIYTDDGGDGTITAASGDKVYAYFGLRRGGRNIYALDLSDPDSPSYLWQINGGSGAFAELGQTWSVPIVTKIPGYTYDHDNSGLTPEIPKPVLVFGAGYDTNKDSKDIASEDSVGRGLFIVDAFTGDLVWSITPADNSATNLKADIQHSVPANITPVDSNADELTDRLYFGDTGGNLWRVDMPGNSLPTSAQNTWSIVQFADVNQGTTATDRRFFSAPDVVRTRQKVCTEFYPSPDEDVCKVLTTINFDAVLIGTGDRTNPNGTDVENQFYMFRDEQIAVYDEPAMSPSECTEAANDDDIQIDFRCYLPFAPSDLYNATANLVQTGDVDQVEAASSALENSNGWLIDLSGSGEKSLARSLTLFGSVFFTTFTPSTGLITSCQPRSGTGRLYQVDIINAGAKRDFNNDGTLDRSTELGTLIPDTPSPHFGSDKKIRLLFPSGGGLLSGNPLDTGAQLPQPYGIYWYREEF